MRGSKMEIRDWMNQERENRTKRTATGRIFIIAFHKESITNLFITMMIEKLGNNHQLKTDETCPKTLRTCLYVNTYIINNYKTAFTFYRH